MTWLINQTQNITAITLPLELSDISCVCNNSGLKVMMGKEKILLAEAIKESKSKHIDIHCLANYIDLVNQTIGIKFMTSV